MAEIFISFKADNLDELMQIILRFALKGKSPPSWLGAPLDDEAIQAEAEARERIDAEDAVEDAAEDAEATARIPDARADASSEPHRQSGREPLVRRACLRATPAPAPAPARSSRSGSSAARHAQGGRHRRRAPGAERGGFEEDPRSLAGVQRHDWFALRDERRGQTPGRAL